MSTVIRSNMDNFLEPILFTDWDEEFNRVPEKFPQIMNMATSSKNKETIAAVTGFGLFSAKDEGDNIQEDAYYQGAKTEITHVTYASRFSVSREQIEDTQYAAAKKEARDLAIASKETRETLAWSMLNNGFSGNFVGGDDKALFATDHPLYGDQGGTEQNEPTTDADLTVSSLQTAIIDIADTRDDRNLRLQIIPQFLIVPTALKFTAGEILTSNYKPYTANRERNVLVDEDITMMTVRYLTDPDAWFIKCDRHGMFWFDRRKTDFGQDTVFTTESLQYKSTFRVGYGWGDWRGWYGNTGA